MRNEKNLRVALRYWRKRRNMTIEGLAQEAHVSTRTITKIENTGHVPAPAVMGRLSKTLNVSIDDLLIDDAEAPSSAA